MSDGVGLRSERGPVLLAIMLSIGLVAIDSTALAPAVLSITGELGGFASFPWLFSIYLLTSAVSVPIYGKLADTVGRKPVMLVGIGLFLLGSILCAVAWSMPALIVFRAIQGLGAGAIQPVAMTILGDIYSVAERARVQGYTAGVWAVSAVLGPSIGGIFAQFDAWRGIFLINLPLGAFATWIVVRRYRERPQRRSHRIDVAGAALLAIGAALVVLGVLEGGNAWPWWSVTSVAVLGGGALALAAFALVERRAAEPVLPLAIFRRPLIAASTAMNLAVGGGLIGLTAFIPAYLELGAGATPLVAGLALATVTIGWPFAATVAGRLYLRFGFRATTILGGALLVVAAASLALLAAYPSVWIVGIAGLVIGAGFGFAAVPSLVAAQASAPWGERGVVTGAIVFARSLGQSVGAAILGAIANAVIAARGGVETDPGTIVAATGAVFVGVLAMAVVVLVSALAMPRTVPVVEDPEPDAA